VAVIDVYTGQWGACEMVAQHFQNYFYDLGETLGLKFVRACSDKVSALKDYQNKSSSTFLFYLVRRRRPKPRARAARRPSLARLARAAAHVLRRLVCVDSRASLAGRPRD